jgi:hypothetical protein
MIDVVEARMGPVSENRQSLADGGRTARRGDARAARAELDVIARRLNATSPAVANLEAFTSNRPGSSILPSGAWR